MTPYFEQTSDKPYDRHHYVIVTKAGYTFTYESYDIMQRAWFNSHAMKNLDHVSVIDVPSKQQSKGFK